MNNGVQLSSRCSGYSVILAPRVTAFTFNDFTCVLNANEYLALGDSCVLSLRGCSTIELNKDATVYCSKLMLRPATATEATLIIRRPVDSFEQFYSIVHCMNETDMDLGAVAKTDDGCYEITYTVRPRK